MSNQQQLKEELQLYRSQLSKLSVERDQTVFELNKVIRLVERLQIKITEKDAEILMLHTQLDEQEKYHQIQLEQVKQHYEYLKESAIVRLKSEMNFDSEIMTKEIQETKQLYQEILVMEAKRKSSCSQEETHCQSINDYQKLFTEKQELQQLVDKLQRVKDSQECDQSDELIQEIQYLREQLQKLTIELETAKQTINVLQVQILKQQDLLKEYYSNDFQG
ncbi:unnamed protein product (macronuclear) [Paramecium tetraurelia]|uniref:Uncharacterized protein n=1 Tax=Paramecium tetraurelia TaxID=5888 RepID=A0CIH1_PARTE|nr:uncharacterized protein GSPATT00007723001 [Paramecium tetraurelia]CAK70588.1 unnamed protein product [Paramecium tetraurelia]|eukprot:XP_001437985.1 hypothetical protein (macronuclear) [Paramecium tetraurelia strain d4-2]